MLFLHVHRAGPAATDHSIVRPVPAHSAGRWQRSIAASSGYRRHVSRRAVDTPAGWATYRFTAR